MFKHNDDNAQKKSLTIVKGSRSVWIQYVPRTSGTESENITITDPLQEVQFEELQHLYVESNLIAPIKNVMITIAWT